MRHREHVQRFIEEIWRWYAEHKRSLPWRDLKDKEENQRAYKVLVSEIMLQQTQVLRVKIVFRKFLKQFPKIEDLAQASNRDVLIAWRGMGYNSRVLRLRDAAKMIMERFEGAFPKSMEELQSIKGIGHYTAAAIRNFAFGIPTPCLETNIRRVLHTTFVGLPNADGTWRMNDKRLLKLAEEVLHEVLRQGETSNQPFEALKSSQALNGKLKTKNLSADWHAALMDYGSLVLKGASGKMKRAKKEPGRTVGSRFIPNRIFRGRIVETLRDARRGLPFSELGRRVCLDWKSSEHKDWLKGILVKLEKDALLERRGANYALRQ